MCLSLVRECREAVRNVHLVVTCCKHFNSFLRFRSICYFDKHVDLWVRFLPHRLLVTSYFAAMAAFSSVSVYRTQFYITLLALNLEAASLKQSGKHLTALINLNLLQIRTFRMNAPSQVECAAINDAFGSFRLIIEAPNKQSVIVDH